MNALHPVTIKRPGIGHSTDKVWESEARRLQKLAANLTDRLAEAEKLIQTLQGQITGNPESNGDPDKGDPVAIPVVPVPPVQPADPGGPVITLHRSEAFGDVIMASAIASRLHEQGYSVRFSCRAEVQPAMQGHPHIATVGLFENPDVNLDGAYEAHMATNKGRWVDMMANSAREQLAKIGVAFEGNHNLTPIVCVSDDEVQSAERMVEGHDRPFVMFNPASGAWPNRTVIREVWEKVTCQGTKFWCGHGNAPAGFVDLKIRRWRDLVGAIAMADICVSVDTGPLHIAAGLAIPTVAIDQCNIIGQRVLGDQTDWISVGASLDCLGCGERTCPIDPANPPCARPDPDRISAAIAARLATVLGNRVSAIIPVLRPAPRLLRCIEAVKDQVDEIVITLDGDANLDGFLPDNPKIVVIKNPTGERTGFGRTVGRAVRHSTGRFLLLLNDDAYADPGSVARLREAMVEGVAVVGAMTRYGDGRIYHAGTARKDAGFSHIDHNKNVSQASIRSRTEMDFVNLAFALVRREAYFCVHGFDQRYDCYAEDSDFCLSVRENGWKVMYEPEATAIHDEGQSTDTRRKLEMIRDGNIKLAAKWSAYFKTGTFA